MGCQSIAGLPPSIKFTCTLICIWVERGTVRVKCLTLEHNTVIQVTVPFILSIKSRDSKVFVTTIKPTFSIVMQVIVIGFSSHVICVNII